MIVCLKIVGYSFHVMKKLLSQVEYTDIPKATLPILTML